MFVVAGAGIVGLATALELKRRFPRDRVVVLEAADTIASAQTAHNSGVVHAGIYYRPGSLKARLCVEGARLIAERCERLDLPFRRCGKLIVARDGRERERLDELARRAKANGVSGARIVGRDEIRMREPHCAGIAALWSPATAVTDFRAVALSLADELRSHGGEIRTGARVVGVERALGASGRDVARSAPLAVRLAGGEVVGARFLVACAGLGADRLAAAAGIATPVRIVPFRGGYRLVNGGSAELVRALVYPVPDPRLPFLGVHLSRHIDGSVTLGPTALPWPWRAHAPRLRGRELVRDLRDFFAWRGTVRALWRHRRAGLRELVVAVCPALLAHAARSYVPALDPHDLRPGPAGVRAQAVARDGTLVDDFLVVEGERQLHVLNAPSPAATSALALARTIAARAAARID